MDRGSRKRLQRIKWSENTSVEFWFFVVLMLFLLLVVLPWLIKHPLWDDHPGDSGCLWDDPYRFERVPSLAQSAGRKLPPGRGHEAGTLPREPRGPDSPGAS